MRPELHHPEHHPERQPEHHPEHHPDRRTNLTVLIAVLAAFLATSASAQDVPPPPADVDAAVEAVSDETPETDAVTEDERRHRGRFALAAGVQHIIPINILKENIHDINDLTAASLAYSVGGRLFILDELAVGFDLRRGGNTFVSDKVGEMETIDALLDGEGTFTPDSFLKLDGFAVSLTTYVGDQLTPDSRFNPYVSGSFLYYDWALTDDGRDGNVLSYQDELIEGQDYGVGFGIGTEFAFSDNALVELGMIWNYLLTGDEIKFDRFQADNDSYYWTNTHWWGLNANLVLVF